MNELLAAPGVVVAVAVLALVGLAACLIDWWSDR